MDTWTMELAVSAKWGLLFFSVVAAILAGIATDFKDSRARYIWIAAGVMLLLAWVTPSKEAIQEMRDKKRVVVRVETWNRVLREMEKGYREAIMCRAELSRKPQGKGDRGGH
jgi:hypothetical protein